MYSRLLVNLYGIKRAFIKKLVIKIVNNLEGGESYSQTLREIFRRYYELDIGMYTHGGCFVPFSFGRKTTIGRYSSVAHSAFGATLNHPMHYKSMHGFFFNSALGYTSQEREYSPLQIGNDVWLGHNSVIMPSVNSIGDGAVIGAGAIIFKDVPPYAIVVGNPGRVVRYRFSPETIEKLLAEAWWEKSIEELEGDLDEYTKPFGDQASSDEYTTAAT